jgi:hypothetical protein
MASSWFKNRLTSSKQDSGMWAGLADAIQSLVASVVDPYLTRISNKKSIFTMDSEDLGTAIDELGQYFTIRASDASSEQMLLLQRKDEIHFKGTERPITQTFYREFNGIPITWEPLYAPVDTDTYPYGTVLVASDQLDTVGSNYGDMFLTSRGVISIAVNDLLDLIAAGTASSATQEEITEEALTKFKQVVSPLLPCHIVFDGMSLYMEVSVTEIAEKVIYDSLAVDAGTYVAPENTEEALWNAEVAEPKQTASQSTTWPEIFNRFDDVRFDTLVFDYVYVPHIHRMDEVRTDEVFSNQITVQPPAISLNDSRLAASNDLSTIAVTMTEGYGIQVGNDAGSVITYSRDDDSDTITIPYDSTIIKIEFLS